MCYSVVFAIVLLNQPLGKDYKPNDANLREKMTFIAAGMLDGRRQIHSGVYRAYGRRMDQVNGHIHVDGPMTILSAFEGEDFQRFRFDQSAPYRTGPSTKKVLKEKESVTIKNSKLILDKNDVIYHYQNNSSAYIRKSSQSMTEVDEYARPFDVRLLGLFFWSGYHRMEKLSENVAWWMRATPVSIDNTAGKDKIAWVLPVQGGYQNHITLWVDESRGFTPIRFDLKMSYGSGDSIQWMDLHETCEVGWSQISGVWVPTSLQHEATFAEKAEAKISLAFDWESVNAPVDPRYFGIEGFELKKDKVVIDARLPKSFTAGRIDENYKFIPGGSGTVGIPPAAVPGWSRSTKLFVLNGVLVLGVIGFLLYRGRKSREAA